MLALNWRYPGRMPSVQIKNVPTEVHQALRRRAAASGRSLQEYLLERLVEDADTPTIDELFDRAGGRAGGRAGLDLAAASVRSDRDGR